MAEEDVRQTELARRARDAAKHGTTSPLPGGSYDSVSRALAGGAISAEEAEKLREKGGRKLLKNLREAVAARKNPGFQNSADIADLENGKTSR